MQSGGKWDKMGVLVGESVAKWDAGLPGVLQLKAKIEHMFLGQYTYRIDTKGRMTVPARFREELTDGAYISQGFERNLMVLTDSSFELIAKKANEMSITDPTARQLKRLIFASADRVELDRAGRILIPQFLREVANLDGDAIVVGVGDYFEIWSPDAWEPQADQLLDADANAQRFAVLDLSGSSARAGTAG